MAYGMALKQRVLKLYDENEQTADIARRFCVSRSWCRRVRQRRHEPPRKIKGRPPKLDATARQYLAEWVAERPDATLEELRTRCLTELGVAISIGALWNTLRRMKLTLKKSP
jgi:transposase